MSVSPVFEKFSGFHLHLWVYKVGAYVKTVLVLSLTGNNSPTHPAELCS